MSITGIGWEILITRIAEQTLPKSGRRRTVGTYEIFSNGVRQDGNGLSGAIAECLGPGSNASANGRRIEPGRYPLWTQDGKRYATVGYDDAKHRKPAIELKNTGNRSEILIHRGKSFLASEGCINLTSRLDSYEDQMDEVESRARVIAVIEHLKAALGERFPNRDGYRIPDAFAVVVGEPARAQSVRRPSK